MVHAIAKVWVNEDTCASHWACIIPDSKTFLDIGNYFPAVADDAASHFVERRREIIEAVLSCPTSSLFLQFDDGKIITSSDYDPIRGVEEWINY